jgi:glycosyltransferase involved in cell wall biosynthesis
LYSGYIDHFIGVSDYTRKHILKDYGSFLDRKTKVIYNGIDTSVFVKRTAENNNKFIVTSHLRESKGIQDLIKAVSILEKEIKNQMQIDIYGEGPYENILSAMVIEFGLEKTIQFKGSSSDINTLLANYSYLLQPTYMECFSLSILESLAANVPVITTTVGGNLEIIENDKNGFIFEPNDYLALAKILKNIVLGNKSINNEVFRPIEKDYNLEKMVNNHIQLLS